MKKATNWQLFSKTKALIKKIDEKNIFKLQFCVCLPNFSKISPKTIVFNCNREKKTSNVIVYATVQKLKSCCEKFCGRNIEILVEGEKNMQKHSNGKNLTHISTVINWSKIKT